MLALILWVAGQVCIYLLMTVTVIQSPFISHYVLAYRDSGFIKHSALNF